MSYLILKMVKMNLSESQNVMKLLILEVTRRLLELKIPTKSGPFKSKNNA